VGTLWQVDDETCGRIASGVYQELAKNGISDEALYTGIHKSILALRDDWLEHTLQEGGAIADTQTANKRGTEKEEEFEELARTMRSLQISEARSRIAGHRHAKARTTHLKTGRLVKADWIPFMHYGA
jgi:hypothetical protein